MWLPQPEFLADVQQCSKAVYLRVEEATQCAVRRCAVQAAALVAQAVPMLQPASSSDCGRQARTPCSFSGLLACNARDF